VGGALSRGGGEKVSLLGEGKIDPEGKGTQFLKTVDATMIWKEGFRSMEKGGKTN